MDHYWEINDSDTPITPYGSNLDWALEDYVLQQVVNETDEEEIGLCGLTESVIGREHKNPNLVDGKLGQSSMKYLGKGANYLLHEMYSEVELAVLRAQVKRLDEEAQIHRLPTGLRHLLMEDDLGNPTHTPDSPNEGLTLIHCKATPVDCLTDQIVKTLDIAAMIDGGSALNVITPDLVHLLGLETWDAPKPVRIRNVSGTVNDCNQLCKIYITTTGKVVKVKPH